MVESLMVLQPASQVALTLTQHLALHLTLALALHLALELVDLQLLVVLLMDLLEALMVARAAALQAALQAAAALPDRATSTILTALSKLRTRAATVLMVPSLRPSNTSST
jgi:hypothetical protein